jgi:hypothetical protein
MLNSAKHNVHLTCGVCGIFELYLRPPARSLAEIVGRQSITIFMCRKK